LKEKSIAQVSLEGKLVNADFATSSGPAGAIRSFDGKIYWASGNQIQSKGDRGVRSEGLIPSDLGAVTDIAIGKKGEIYVGTSSGALVRLTGDKAVTLQKGAPVTGLFLLLDTLYVLRQRFLQGVSLYPETASKTSPVALCEKYCSGLEHTSNGKWLTANGSKILEVSEKGNSRTLYQGDPKALLGRAAYAYQMEPANDFFVVPFPAEGVIRAFRVNAVSK